MRRPNFYQILKIDPWIEDERIIKSEIQRKRIEWSRISQLNNHKGQLAKYFLLMCPEIERTMLDPSMRRREALAAVEIRKKEVIETDKLLRKDISVLELRGFLYKTDITLLAKKYKLTGDEVRKKVNVGIRANPIHEMTNIFTTIEKVQDNLSEGIKDLYEYIGKPKTESLKTLFQCCYHIYEDSGSDLAAKALAAAGLALFENDTSKQMYDEYLKYREIYEEIDLLGSSGTTILAISVENCLNKLTKLGPVKRLWIYS